MMFNVSSLKRKSDKETVTHSVSKRPKLEEFNVNNGKSKNSKLVSFILNDQTRDVQISPCQLVWARMEKSAFWPSMVWSTKTGQVIDDKQRVLVKFFAKGDTSIWIKLDNVFPFDGFESFEKMKNSVDQNRLTPTLKRDFDYAFNVTNKLWPRAVAQAIFCLYKNREERQALFRTFSLSQSRKHFRNSIQRRSIGQKNQLTKACRVNDELNEVKSFVKEINSPIVSTTTAKDTAHVDEMLSKFVVESINAAKFKDGIDKVCNICVTCAPMDQLIKCTGFCNGYIHQKCFEDRTHSTQPICEDCVNESLMLCSICKTGDDSAQSEMINCSLANCLRRYHTSCLNNWPQVKWNDVDQKLSLICPVHECHQCGANSLTKDHEPTVMTCIKCPTVLHNDGSCIHAGTIILSYSHNICIKHRPLRQNAFNLDYCFICKMSCNLLRCINCPHSYHESCLPSTSTCSLSCTKCSSGQHPVYGDIVWAKLYTYAWWPAIIVPPHCVPQNIRSYKHLPHAVCVCFFGDYSFSWIDRQSMHPFDEDNFALITESSNKFGEAILSARKWTAEAKSIKLKSTVSDNVLVPPPFTNVTQLLSISPARPFFDRNNEASTCKCAEDDSDPCGVTSNCLTRASCTECNELCRSGDKCGNKCIQLGKYSKTNLKHFGEKGFGLVSAERIPIDTIVQQYTGELITTYEFERRMKDTTRKNVYFMKYSKDLLIDGETKGSLARYINHSCNPNCEFRLWSVNGVNVVVVVALKDIPKDTEITCAYSWSMNISCMCGETECTGFC